MLTGLFVSNTFMLYLIIPDDQKCKSSLNWRLGLTETVLKVNGFKHSAPLPSFVLQVLHSFSTPFAVNVGQIPLKALANSRLPLVPSVRVKWECPIQHWGPKTTPSEHPFPSKQRFLAGSVMSVVFSL